MDNEQVIKNTLKFIADFGDCDGAHHKQWALDQIVRILTNSPIVEQARIDFVCTIEDGYSQIDYMDKVLGKSEQYFEWLREYMNGEDGPNTYEWDEGSAP